VVPRIVFVVGVLSIIAFGVLVMRSPELSAAEQQYLDAVSAHLPASYDPHKIVDGGYELCSQVTALDAFGIDRVDSVLVTAVTLDSDLDPALTYLCPENVAVVSGWPGSTAP
jgi:hypothetical protein